MEFQEKLLLRFTKLYCYQKYPKIPHNLLDRSAYLAKIFGILKKHFHWVSVVSGRVHPLIRSTDCIVNAIYGQSG